MVKDEQAARKETISHNTRSIGIERLSGFIKWSFVVLCILFGIAAMFFASVEQLSTNSGARFRGGGHMFVALVAIVGEPVARGLIASIFFLFAWAITRPSQTKSSQRGKKQKT